MIEAAIHTLKQLFNAQGYVTFDEILTITERFDLELKYVEIITGQLLDERVIILERSPEQNIVYQVNDLEYDRSHLDYERIFAAVLQIAPQLESYINNVRYIPAPGPGEENELIYLAQEGNPYAIERLILMFLKVVIRISLTLHKRYGLPLEETIQDGNVGLIKAISKYIDRPENRFSTYAPWWIRQNIMRNSFGNWGNFYVPSYVKDDLFRISRYIHSKYFDKGDLLSTLSMDEIEKLTGISTEKLNKYLFVFRDPFPPEMLEQYSQECAWERTLETRILSKIVINNLKREISTRLNGISNRDKSIFEMRIGSSGREPMTYQEIGDELGLTRERIRQILNRISKKFHKNFFSD